jgi:hypothetical protein
MKIDPNPSNSIPEDPALLFPVAKEMVAGLSKLEKTLGVTQNKASVVTSDLKAATAAQAKYEELKGKSAKELAPAFRTLSTQVDGAIALGKTVLRVHLGNRWTEQWGEAGFLNRSLQSPTNIEGREKTLQGLVTYFQNNPDQETTKPEVNAVKLAKLLAAYSAARTAVKEHPEQRKAAKDARDNAVRRLRQRLRATIAELILVLPSDSTHWGAFGLTPPALIGRRRSRKVAAEGSATSASSPRSGSSANGAHAQSANGEAPAKVALAD